jgi:PiT family inorganic phosphate transporter
MGANNSAGCVGTTVECGLSRKHALALFTVFLAAGVMIEGWKNMGTVGNGLIVGLLRNPAVDLSLIAITTLLVSGTIVAVSTVLGVPMSMSHTMVGAVIGSGLAVSIMRPDAGIWTNTGLLAAVLISWALTPLLSAVLAFLLSRATGSLTARIRDIAGVAKFLFLGLILTSAFTAYAFGANDLGASTGLFYAFFADRGLPWAALAAGALGLVGAAAGAMMLSGRVMRTVQSGIIRLDPFTAFSAQLGTAAVVWFFVQLHLPVSTTQAFVGGLVGTGMAKGMRAINSVKLRQIAKTWALAPILSFSISLAVNLVVLS